MVDKWTSILLKITLSPPLPLGLQCREITLVITMWVSPFFSSKRQAISLRTLIHETQSSNSFYVPDSYLYNTCHYLQQWNDMLYSSWQRPNCYSKSHSWEFYMEIYELKKKFLWKNTTHLCVAKHCSLHQPAVLTTTYYDLKHAK